MFEKIERVAIAVKDLDKAKAFFSDLLDIDFDVVGEMEQLGMRGGYSAFGLELIESCTPGSMIERFIDQRGEGLWAVVIKVKNMDAAVEKCLAKGMKIAGDITYGAMREVAFHPKDSHGVEIVLAEYREKHPATVAAETKP
jgi:predicted enzyme related to lactoylglutathione lyase